jgi:ATP synthase F1 delta subunit
MKVVSEITAKKYALAFLNLYESQITQLFLKNITLFESFLNHHPEINAYFLLSLISKKQQDKFINELIAQFDLNAHVHSLITTLIAHKRFFLLPLILDRIIQIYNKQHRIIECVIKSSHDLSNDDKNKLLSFASCLLESASIKAQFVVSPELICGIRIQSDSLLWEQSINKTLQQAEYLLFQRAQL